MLQRSVTLIRRLLWTRPNLSTRRSLGWVGIMAGPIGVRAARRSGPRSVRRFSIPDAAGRRHPTELPHRGMTRSRIFLLSRPFFLFSSPFVTSCPHRLRHPRVDPLLGAVGPDLFLPDRDDLLEGVDEPLAGFERLVSVGAAHGDHDA